MILIKVLLVGLVGVSLGMANISGIVTDTGITPISGVVVQLEKGGQTATTGADGRFTLVIGSSSILPVKCKLLRNGLSARISGTMLHLTTAELSAVEIAMFDIGGKSLLIVRKSLNAGSHSLSLPYHGAGVYFYKVKSGNSEIVLKGNTANWVSSGSSALSQGSSSNHLAKQAKATAVINDVISATKAGMLYYRCVIGNSDTIGITIKLIVNAGDVTDADGNVYQTVRIGNQVWMTENLRVTKYNDGITAIPKDTSKATWANGTTPKYCYYKNTTNADSIKKYGALYNWYVVSPANDKKIAPTGWHVPSDSEFQELINNLGGMYEAGGKLKEAGIIHWDSPNSGATNSTGFAALPGGYRNGAGDFANIGKEGMWWSSTIGAPYGTYASYFGLSFNSTLAGRDNHLVNEFGFTIRCLKD